MGTKIKDAQLLESITGEERIPVSNGSDKPATITVNQILEKTKTSTNILEVTYDELKNLKDNSQLVPEQKYRMIDYETIVQGDDVRSAGHVFDLILTAKSKNQLYDLCQAKQSERDTEGYFSHSDLDSWKVYYTMDTGQYSHVPRKGNGVVVDVLGAGEEYSQYHMTMYCDPLPNGNYQWDGMMYMQDVEGYYIQFILETTEPTLDNVVSFTMRIFQSGVLMDEETNTNPDEFGSMTENLQQAIVSTFNNEIGAKGYIYRLIDEFNNDVSYDFKNIQYLIPLVNRSYGWNDETGLNNGWKYVANSDPTEISNQYVYTFNRQDEQHVYHDLSLNYSQGELQCLNNCIKSSNKLPKNIILTNDELDDRGSDGEPEAEIITNNNYFDQYSFNNIFNVCSDSKFEKCVNNAGNGILLSNFQNVYGCLFQNTQYNIYFDIVQSNFTGCYSSNFKTQVHKSNISNTDSLEVHQVSESTVNNVGNCPQISSIENCDITNLTNVDIESSRNNQLSFVDSKVFLAGVTFNKGFSFYDSCLNIQNCNCSCSQTYPSISNADIIISGYYSKRIDFAMETSTLMYTSNFKTYARVAPDNTTVFQYTDFDLFNQAGASYLVDALNTPI